MRHLRAILGVLVWPCEWHWPGDDECVVHFDWPAEHLELVYVWSHRIPRRLHGVLR